MQSDLVITGASVLSPLGIGYQEFKKGLQEGVPKTGPITIFGPEKDEFTGGQVWDFDARALLGRKGLRTLDRNTLLILAALQLDIADVLEGLNKEEVGLCMGTTYGSFTSLSDFTELYLRKGARALNPMLFPNLVINCPTSQGNVRLGLTKSSSTISNGFTGGIDAVVYSADRIQRGYENITICGGSEELSYEVTVGYKINDWLSSSDSARPFDAKGNGTLMGEGSAAFILETKENAAARAATPIVDILAYSTCFDGSFEHPINPEGDGGVHVIETVVKEAGISHEDIGFISTSANGIPSLDAIEAKVLNRVFGENLSSIPTVAYKAYWGECLSASGALQLAGAIADVEAGRVSGTPTCEEISADYGSLWVPSKALSISSPYALVFSTGYSGNFTAMLIKKSI